jgi:hypothetical protein
MLGDITNPPPITLSKEEHKMIGNGSSPHRNGNSAESDGVTIRPLEGGDTDALRVLAELDTARPPSGEVLGAEREGRLVAAISLLNGDVVADPFHPTAEVVTLLRVRARQLVPPLA